MVKKKKKKLSQFIYTKLINKLKNGREWWEVRFGHSLTPIQNDKKKLVQSLQNKYKDNSIKIQRKFNNGVPFFFLKES